MNGTDFSDLRNVAARLEGLEESIIVALIERAQFCLNPRVYIPGESGFEDAGELSLLDLRLRMQEEVEAVFGRFMVPEERPFSANLPETKRKVNQESSLLLLDDYDIVNLNDGIRRSYLDLLPLLCREGDDRHYGSSVENDVHALRAISHRVHFGAMYVAECKYSADVGGYSRLLDAADREALLTKLTRIEVEEKILQRVHDKIAALQQQANPLVRHLVDGKIIVDFYRNVIIPLTKEGELLYLFNRRRG